MVACLATAADYNAGTKEGVEGLHADRERLERQLAADVALLDQMKGECREPVWGHAQPAYSTQEDQ